MAGPGGREVGRVSVRVLPDTSSFGASLEKYLERTEKRLRLEIPVSLQAGDVARTEAELAALTKDRTVHVKTDVDSSAVDKIAKSFGHGAGGVGGLGSLPTVAALITAALPALFALPSALALIAAPIAVIAAGFDGIKKASAGFLEALKVVASTTSGIFAQVLPNAFKKLTTLIPFLVTGFTVVALAISDVFSSVADAITSPAGITAISDTFNNIGTLISGLAPSFGQLTTLFLQLVDQGSKAMVQFLPSLIFIIDEFVKLTNLLISSGALAQAFQTFNALLAGTFAVIGAVIIVSTLFYAGLNLIATAIAKVITVLVTVIAAIGSLPSKIGGALASLPGIIGAAFTTAWNAAVTATKTAIGAVATLASGIGGKVKSAVGDLGSVLYNAGKAVIQGLIDGIGAMFKPLGTALGKVGSFIKAHKGPPSKDRVMLFPAGKLIMDGLVDGLGFGERALGFQLASINSQITNGIRAHDFSSSLDAGSTAGQGGTVGALTITNWKDGTGHFQMIADGQIADHDLQGAMIARGF